MIPKIADRSEFIIEKQPSKTYAIDFETNRIAGLIDEKEAVKQAIYKILDTQRYENIIYSWNYGMEAYEMSGQSKAYACSEISGRIKEALMQDDRITDVDSFEYSVGRSSIDVSFVAHTIYGNIEDKKEVSI